MSHSGVPALTDSRSWAGVYDRFSPDSSPGGVLWITLGPSFEGGPVPNRYLRYGDQRYIINKEAEARLNRTLDAVYADGTRGHEWLNLYHDSAAPCRLLIAPGVPITIETEPSVGE
jgi:hypothetical protein